MLKRLRLAGETWWADVALGVVASAACLALYLRTIAPGVLGGDAGELQFVPYILSLAHPTGYPLHTLFGRLWAALVPIGSVAYSMNLLSAVAGAGAVGLVYGAIRVSTGSRFGGLAAALLLGVSPLFWEQSLTADKYALTNLMLAALLYALVRWSAAPEERALRWCALLCGLGVTQHRSLALLVPAVVGYWLWRDRRLLRDRRYAARIAALLLAPLALFAWLPIGAGRHLPPGSWPMESVSDWVEYLLDRGYLGEIRPFANLGSNLAFYWRTLLAQFGVAGVGLGLLGAASQAGERKPLGAFVAIGFALEAVLSAGYNVPRFWIFFLPSFVLFTLWIGEGFASLWSGATALLRRSKPLGLALGAPLALLACLLVAVTVREHYPAFREAHLDGGALDLWRQDLKSGYRAERLATLSLSTVEPGAIIVCDWEQATPLWYYQQVEGWRADVRVLYPINRWPEALATGRPTYLARTLPGIGEPYHLSTAGPLVRIGAGPTDELPAGATPAGIHWEEGIELAGYEYHRTDLEQGYVWPVSLYFRTARPLNTDYSLSVRLWREDGTQVWAEDRQHPVLGLYPTSRWAPGEVVADYFEVPFPRTLPAGRYRIGIILYTALEGGGWRNLTVQETGEQVAYLPTLDVPPRR